MFYVFYSIILFLLTVYSYSQIDLNLTLSSNQIYQNIQQKLIYLGYFNRPLSTMIFLILVFLLSAIYLLILYLIKQKRLSLINIKWLVSVSCVILLFSYSAFSHDLFNYMFDARIVTTYAQNPYVRSALDFPGDLWIRFMHWTHRTYPYGPVWLLLTLPFSILGFGKFVLTLFAFKLMFTIFHLGNVYLIYKILKKTTPKLSLLGTAVYAFNPVVLIESLVSPHNEVVMLFFLLWAIYFITCENNKLAAIFNLLLSAGIKFVTIILLPIFLFKNFARNFNLFLILNLILLIPPLALQIILREPYPWYFIPLIGLGALLIQYPSINILIGGISFSAMLRYLPFLYLGEYSQTTTNAQNIIFFASIAVTVVLAFLSLRLTRQNRANR